MMGAQAISLTKAGHKPGRQRGELDDLTLARARQGDSAAQGALVQRYQRPVVALVSRMMVGQPGDQVEDLAQESMIKVLQGLHRFESGGRARLSTWILTIATRTCIDALRRSRPVDSLSDADEEGDAGANPEQRVASRMLAREVTAAMARLSPEHRAVLVLRAYHDMDYPEIARALGVETGTVKSRLSRARAALKGLIPQEQRSRS